MLHSVFGVPSGQSIGEETAKVNKEAYEQAQATYETTTGASQLWQPKTQFPSKSVSEASVAREIKRNEICLLRRRHP